MEERLERQKKANRELSNEISQLNDSSKNMSDVVKKEVEKMQRRTGLVNTGWGGAEGKRPPYAIRTVRGFSMARRKDKQMEALVDFSMVMEVDEDGDDDWEE